MCPVLCGVDSALYCVVDMGPVLCGIDVPCTVWYICALYCVV